MVRFLFILICAIASAFGILAVNTDIAIFSPDFRTLKCAAADNFMSLPIIRLGTADKVVITFDEIGEDQSYLEYRLLHCNADWQPSRLVESEYLDGFNSAKIEDVGFSSATFVHYINYRIELPNEDMEILHSGNYLLQVYNPDNPDETLLQTRFQVSENFARVEGDVTSRTDRGHYSGFQQLEFTVETEGMQRLNPYQDIEVRAMQNLDAKSERVLRSPQRVDGTRLIYAHQPELIFTAGNEYRRFESTSNYFPGMNVDSVKYMGSNYHVWLKPDGLRASRQYTFDRTQHGRFLVKAYNASDSDLGADYVTVHFMLCADGRLPGEVYINGEFTESMRPEQCRLVYSPEKSVYEAEIPLKQGAYNYQYLLKTAEAPGGDATPIEGDKYETENEYNISVWYRLPGARADRLIGTSTLLSH